MRGSRLLMRYVAREFVLWFAAAFLFFFSIFFVNVLLVTATDIMAKQVPIEDVVRLVTYSLPQIVHLSFPFSTLLAALLVLGRLSGDRELIAVQALGIPLSRGLAPIVGFGMLFAGLSFATNDMLLPASTIEFNRVYRSIIYRNPGLELEPDSVKQFEDTAIVTGELAGEALRDITILDRDSSGELRVITARDLRLVDSGQQTGVITLRLGDVFTHLSGSGRGDFEYVSADVLDYQIVLPEIIEALVDIGPGEQSSRDVWRSITELRGDWQRERDRIRSGLAYALLFDLAAVTEGSELPAPAQRASWLGERRERLQGGLRKLIDADGERHGRELRNHLFEFHKKVAVPAGCLVFTLFAIPAGLLVPRSGRAYGLLVGMGVLVIYWALLVSAHSGGLRFRLSPAVAVWTPNLVVLTLAAGIWGIRRWRRGFNG
ncbi:MAG: LptF/LptG family permease [Spirochaetaceae bacterium]|nr:LptF/LptG family permease [Spirochaetaceae bacterium]